MSIRWNFKHYRDLKVDEFHDLIAARIDVFVIEQDCPYQDLEGKDKVAYHIWASDQDENVLAYARILPSGVSYKEVSIGRVITTKIGRGKGLGHELMSRGMDCVKSTFGDVDVRISAQAQIGRAHV